MRSALIAIIGVTIGAVNGYIVDLEPNVRTCFFEPIEVGGKLSINYEVDPGFSGSVAFDAYNPSGQSILNVKPERYGTYYIRAHNKGKHHYCFTATTSFPLEFSILGSNYAEKSNNNDLATELQQLKMALSAIRDEQVFHLRREEVHNTISKKINRYVLWWCMIQYLVILLVCIWQIYYLKNFFKAKK